MKITIHKTKCIGAGQCVSAAPDLFSQDDDDGIVILLKESADDGEVHAAQDGLHLCPALAIDLTDELATRPLFCPSPAIGGRYDMSHRGGLGVRRAVVRTFAAAGANVGCIDRNEAGILETLVQVRRKGATGAFCSCAVDDAEALARALPELEATLGAPYILVNCAGISERHLAETFPNEAWSRILGVNLGAAFRLCRHVAPYIIRRAAGQIVIISSVCGSTGYPGTIAYLASKGGLETVTRGPAAEWGKHDIMVSSIATTLEATPLLEQMRAEAPERIDRMLNRAQIRWIVETSEVADAVLFLCSRSARTINGHILPLDGGYLAK